MLQVWKQRSFCCAKQETSSEEDESSSCFMAKVTKVQSCDDESDEEHRVLDSGCTQHMTGDARMFNSINTNDNDSYDSIIFGDNGKDKVKGLGKIAISNDLSNIQCATSREFEL